MTKTSTDGHKTIREVARIIESDRGYAHARDTYFRDMVETWTVALRNAVEPRDAEWERREARFEQIKGIYGAETVAVFSQVLGEMTSMALRSMGDHLGALNAELELGRKGSGQFFTPYHVSRMMAGIMHDSSVEDAIREHGWMTLSEPTCGSGGMIVAYAEQMRDSGQDPSTQLRVFAQDIDIHCVNMCYVQMRLNAIPAVVVHGDTLRNEQRSFMMTPQYVAQEAANPAA